jgi:hypothetical protein
MFLWASNFPVGKKATRIKACDRSRGKTHVTKSILLSSQKAILEK